MFGSDESDQVPLVLNCYPVATRGQSSLTLQNNNTFDTCIMQANLVIQLAHFTLQVYVLYLCVH